MALGNPRGGQNWQSEYAISPTPWLTSSTISGIKVHTFDLLTRHLFVRNDGPGDMRMGFTGPGITGSNYVKLAVSQSFDQEVRVKELWLSGANSNQYSVFAGLTGIDSGPIPALVWGTGSNV